MSGTLPSWVADEALGSLWVVIRRRLESYGLDWRGRIRFDLDGRPQRHALGALLGRTLTRDRVRLDLGELDARLRERSGVGGLTAVLELVTGAPLEDRAEQRTARARGREQPLEFAERSLDAPWVAEWVAGLRRTGMLSNRAEAMSVIADAVSLLRALTSQPELAGGSRVELAARLVGDAHALDDDRLLPQVVLRGLAAARGIPPPATAAQRRALWEQYAVSPDLVSRTCLTWGLRPRGDCPVTARLRAAAEASDPVHLTAWDLRRLPRLDVAANTTVLVCENPRVLEGVAERASSALPVVCTSGEPNQVVTAVLSGLLAAGAPLAYHGDFDWPGIAIANRIVHRFAATPWLMTADDYEQHVRPESPKLRGAAVEPSWDPELGAAMRRHGRCLHEETVLPVLLDGLERLR